MIEHHDAVDHAHQNAHDVLDPDDGDTEFVADIAQHVGGLIHFGLVETAEAFIREQQFRAGGERLGEFELLQAGGAETVDAGMPIGRQAHHVKRLLGSLVGILTAVTALAIEAGERDVLEDRQTMERPRNLEGAADAAIDDPVRRMSRDLMAGKIDRACCGHQRARQHVEDRALAGAVRADQAENLALLDPKRHVVDRGEAAEALHQTVHLQHRNPSASAIWSYWLLNVVPFGNGSTASRTAWLFGHTTYDLSSMYCSTTGFERSFWPAICAPSAGNLTPKPSMVPPSGMSTSSAALRSASGSTPPYFLMARGRTSVRNRYVLDAAMPTWAERMATPGFTLSNSWPTILMTGSSFGSRVFSLVSQIEIGSVLKT